MQLSTILELLEGSFYGMDLLKLHSVSQKLTDRMDRIEKVHGERSQISLSFQQEFSGFDSGEPLSFGGCSCRMLGLFPSFLF